MESTTRRHTHIVKNPLVVNLGCVFRRIMWTEYYITKLLCFIFSYALSYFLHIYPTFYFYARHSVFFFVHLYAHFVHLVFCFLALFIALSVLV